MAQEMVGEAAAQEVGQCDGFAPLPFLVELKDRVGSGDADLPGPRETPWIETSGLIPLPGHAAAA